MLAVSVCVSAVSVCVSCVSVCYACVILVLMIVVMNISFSGMFHSVMEGGGFLELTLIKTEGAVGPVTVSLFTAAKSATGETCDANLTQPEP